MSESIDGGGSTRRAQDGLRAGGETDRATLAELLHPGFMAAHTVYATLEDMLGASGLASATDAEVAATLAGEGWSAFVGQTTQFATWDEMVQAAAAEWAERPPTP
jgi:hypothetical protein